MVSDRVARGYDRLAPWYQTIEWLRFGGGLQRSRTALLNELPRCQQALFIGDGDGRLLQAFARQQPDCRVTSIDVSSRMLACQRQRLACLSPRLGEQADGAQYHWVQADIRQYEVPPQQYDLIITAFHLDCFTQSEIESLVDRLGESLRCQGYWYVVDFAVPKRGWRRHWARFWTAVMIAFFRWQTGLASSAIVDIPQVFFDRGWTVLTQQVSPSGMQFSMLLRRQA